MSLSVGSKVQLNDDRVATVRFQGPTNFQTGEWVGVELEEPTGKNDGSVQGVRYFQCRDKYGMFLRQSAVKRVLPDAKPKATAATRALGTGVNGARRQSAVPPAGRRESTLPSSPTPGARAGLTGIRSPTKSPTKHLGNGATNAATSRTATPPAGKRPAGSATTRSRPSMAPPTTSAGRRASTMPAPGAASRTSRPSLAPPSNRSAAAAGRPAAGHVPPSGQRSAVSPSRRGRLSSATEETASDTDSERQRVLSPRNREVSSRLTPSEGDEGEQEEEGDVVEEAEEGSAQDDTVKLNFAPPPPPPPEPAPKSPSLSRPRRPSSPNAPSVRSQQTMRSTTASNRRIEELEAKIRLLERKQLEDRDLRKNLDHAQQERDQYKGIIEKLQTKYRPQQQEIVTLKKALGEAESKVEELEKTQADHDDIMESATLDREMAEERAEGLKTQLAALQTQHEEVTLERDILKEENDELSQEMSPEKRGSAGFVQLQHSNDRLRNALLALRDRAMDEKEELSAQISTLNDQVKDLESLRTEHEDLKVKLLQGEANVDDLHQQLEAAGQAEDMIEELGERNSRLENTIDDLKATIEDLENLRDINEDLDHAHNEAETELRDELDFKDSLLLDRERTAKLQQEALDDRDHTITQFRALVSALQADVADMKASKQLTEIEAKDLESKSRAMLDLNLKLQTSAAKTQVKTIDLELRRLDAQEASEHLAIVQLFLPDAFHSERDSVEALLRFRRIQFKANLVHSFVKERVAAFGTRSMGQDVFAACDVLDKLTWISAMAGRFTNSISSCSPAEFSGYESAYYELEPVERALNAYVDGLRRDELKESEVADELQRSIAVMSHLASLHIKDDLSSHADDLLMRTLCLQSQLESAATALQLMRTLVEKNVEAVAEDDEDDESSASDLAIILDRADTLVTQARSAKVTAGKAQRLLTDLQERQLTLEKSHNDAFDGTEKAVTEIVGYTRQAGDALNMTFSEEGRTESFTPSEVAGALSRAAATSFALQTPESGPFNTLASRIRDLIATLADLAALPAELDNTVEFDRPPEPWVARAEEITQTKLTDRDTEAELARALETLRSRDAVVREKETELEEQSVRVEMLEARLREAGKRAQRISELEGEVWEARERERVAKREVEVAREEGRREVERARAEVGKMGLVDGARGGGAGEHQALEAGAMGVGARVELRRLSGKVAGLEGAVRFLKEENMRLRLPAADSPLSAQQSLAWLHQPLAHGAKKSRAAAAERGRSVLKQMLALATAAPGGEDGAVVDLTSLPENRLAWRPARETPRWRVERRKEEWAGWRAEVAG